MQTPAYDNLRSIVLRRIDSDFNSIPVDVVKAYFEQQGEELSDLKQATPYMEVSSWIESGELDREKFFDWLAREQPYNADYRSLSAEDKGQMLNLRSPYREALIEFGSDDAFLYDWQPVWNRVLECRDSGLGEIVMSKVDELYDIGIGVIAGCEELNAMLFITGGGYDFADAHWIPMFTKVFGCFEKEAQAAEAERREVARKILEGIVL